MEQKKIYIGIDLTDTQAMVTMYAAGMKEPDTIAVGGEERYGIPLAIYLSNMGKAFYGEEALRRKEQPQGEFFDDLYQKALAEIGEESNFYEGLLRQFLQRLIRLKSRFGADTDTAQICLGITIPELTEDVFSLFDQIRKEMELPEDAFFLMDHGESFFAHTYHQDVVIWQHEVALFDFSEKKVSFYLLHRKGGRNLQMVTAEQKCWEVPAHVLPDSPVRDEFFANIIRQAFSNHMISAVYFVGDGFDGGWLKESLRVLGTNKRVFLGKNLFTKGACYGAYRYSSCPDWGFFYQCEYKTQGEIFLQIQKEGSPTLLRLLEAGRNWDYEPPAYELLYDGTPEIVFEIGEIGHGNRRRQSFTLTDMPERPVRTIRFRVQARALDGRRVEVHISDTGFGSFFESTGKTWTVPVVFDTEDKKTGYREHRK